MKSFAVICFVIFSLSFIAAAQSNKSLAASPTPRTDIQNQENSYSESTPNLTERKYRPIPQMINNPPKKSKKSKSRKNSNSKEIGVDDVVKVETKLVTIPVSVYDSDGLYIQNLTQTNFKIFEDGKEQEIAYFGSAEKPFTVVLLLDVSPSTAYRIEDIQDAAIAFTNQLKPQDTVMVIEFDRKVKVLAKPTNERGKIFEAIRKADFGNGTSLYEAVDSSLNKYLNKIDGRKAIVLFTDGVDTTSKKADYENTIAGAEEADSLIFPIYYNTFLYNRNLGRTSASTDSPEDETNQPLGNSRREYALGKQYLEDLAAVTGGRVFRPESTPGGLTSAFEGIAEELRRQYNIGYYPVEGGQTGQRKTIKVRVDRPNLIIRARDSYIVGSNNEVDESN